MDAVREEVEKLIIAVHACPNLAPRRRGNVETPSPPHRVALRTFEFRHPDRPNPLPAMEAEHAECRPADMGLFLQPLIGQGDYFIYHETRPPGGD